LATRRNPALGVKAAKVSHGDHWPVKAAKRKLGLAKSKSGQIALRLNRHASNPLAAVTNTTCATSILSHVNGVVRMRLGSG
jgi:hypothetical protein